MNSDSHVFFVRLSYPIVYNVLIMQLFEYLINFLFFGIIGL